MKLRVRGDTIRLRLKRSDVDRITAGISVVEHTHFMDSVLTYRLDVSESSEISAAFDNGCLAVSLPESMVTDWADTDDVSLCAEQKLSNSGTLSLLIEKDFSCLEPGHHRDSVDDEDTYPHPRARSTG
ncbi:MAG: hypothetical protein ACE5OQ_00835 [Woeseia sp.]